MGYCYCQWLAVIMRAHSFSCSENFPCMPASMWGIFFCLRALLLWLVLLAHFFMESA